jgi:hypothetical protein
MTRVRPTELVARLILSENRDVGSNSAMSHRPGPGMSATASGRCSSAILLARDASSVDFGAFAFAATVSIREFDAVGEIGENTHSIGKGFELHDTYPSGLDSV